LLNDFIGPFLENALRAPYGFVKITILGRVAMGEDAGTSGWIGESGITQDAIRGELSRILASPVFVRSDRLGRFLKFTVETTLAGEAGTLKEYRIGADVYDRRPPYNPSSDSIVRSEARRLRRKLKEYYESYGIGDPVFIYYRPGSYGPVFRRGPSQEGFALATERAMKELLTESTIAKAIEISASQYNNNLQIVFEGTIRISYLSTEPVKPIELETLAEAVETDSTQEGSQNVCNAILTEPICMSRDGESRRTSVNQGVNLAGSVSSKAR
jgi:hypothetical protein